MVGADAVPILGLPNRRSRVRSEIASGVLWARPERGRPPLGEVAPA